MTMAIQVDTLLQKILMLAEQDENMADSIVIIATKGIYESEIEPIANQVEEQLKSMNRDIRIQWHFADTFIRCGMCHSVYTVKKLNHNSVECPICEFKSIEVISDEEVSVFSKIG